MSESSKTNFRKIRGILSGILLVFLILAISKSVMVDPGTSKIPRGKMAEINEFLQGIPGEENGKKYTDYTYRIPEGSPSELIFSMKNYWANLEVLLDGKRIGSFQDPNKELGVHRNWVELPGDSAGKELALRIFDADKYGVQSLKSPVYLGEKDAVFHRILDDGAYAVFFFGMAVFLAMLVFACRMMLRKSLPIGSKKALVSLGAFILDTGIWVLTDTTVLQLFIGNTATVTLISFASFLLMPTFMLMTIREMMIYKKRIFEILQAISMVVVTIILFSYIFRIVPIFKLLVLQHGLILISLAVILKNGIQEVKDYGNEEIKMVISGLKILAVFIVMALLAFYKSPAGRYAYYYSVGLFLFFVAMAYTTFKRVYHRMEENAGIEAYKNLAYHDVMTGLGNRAAFEKVQAQKSAGSQTYIMIDNNNLKAVNDRYGHKEGDRILIDTADCILEVFQEIGECFRIGGDEFVVVVKNMSEKRIQEELELLDQVIARKNRKRNVPIDVAYGYSTGEKEREGRDLFSEADANMYQRKEAMKGEGNAR